MTTKITATELARNLSDILNRVRYKGESFVIERNGEAVATIDAPPKPGITLRELAYLLRELPPLDGKFAEDLERARSTLRDPATPPWLN